MEAEESADSKVDAEGSNEESTGPNDKAESNETPKDSKDIESNETPKDSKDKAESKETPIDSKDEGVGSKEATNAIVEEKPGEEKKKRSRKKT